MVCYEMPQKNEFLETCRDFVDTKNNYQQLQNAYIA